MSTFTVTIDQTSTTPPFRQLHDAVVIAIAGGELVPGSRLPTVRALAERLTLATNTVASAYRSLEESGIVEGRGRAGTFVRLGGDPVEAEARRVTIEAAAELTKLGVSAERAVELVREAFSAQQ